MNKIRLLNLAL